MFCGRVLRMDNNTKVELEDNVILTKKVND